MGQSHLHRIEQEMRQLMDSKARGSVSFLVLSEIHSSHLVLSNFSGKWYSIEISVRHDSHAIKKKRDGHLRSKQW